MTVDLPATACTPGIGPLPLLRHSPLGARAQDRRRTALKANKSHPPRRIAAETCQEEREGWVLNGAGVEGVCLSVYWPATESSKPQEVCAIINPILHVHKLRPKEVESFASGHTAN